MGSPLRNSCPLSSLENVSLSSINVKRESHCVIGSRFHHGAELMSSTGNSKAIVSALKNLQKKIHSLEIERAEAEQKMQSLGFEAILYKNTLEQEKKDASNRTGESDELAVQLTAIEGRCSLLEKQLEYMRTMVEHAETEKNILLEKQASLQMDRHWDHTVLQSKLEKLKILEQECLKINATQTRAESKINELQRKLQEEEHQRKLIQDKAAQLQTGLEISQIHIKSSSTKKKTKVKKRKCIVKNEMKRESPRLRPEQAKFPFVAGTSISSSHSVTANVQNVLHLMKQSSTRTSDRQQTFTDQRAVKKLRAVTCGNVKVNKKNSKFVSFSSPSSLTEELSEILVALQDELSQMSFDHQDLLKQIQSTKNVDIREDLERELDCLIKQMERKGEQISKLKKHQNQVEILNRKANKMRKQMAEPKKLSKTINGMNEAIQFSLKSTSALGKKGKESLQLLRNAQKLQLTLRRNDIVWDQ
ncbi:centrosomal protein cep57l1-like isoform X2 [Narcine bancroftii]|uniref:centrosomal protein cep57l1-like isoform X2 n=1 Tax=Narcine bancroftii TaxID=1343680 RepID=UPI003831E7DC